MNAADATRSPRVHWRVLQISSVTPFLVDSGGAKNWLFVKLETDDGLVGWGEAYTQQDRDAAMLAHLTEMGRFLVGRSPLPSSTSAR